MGVSRSISTNLVAILSVYHIFSFFHRFISKYHRLLGMNEELKKINSDVVRIFKEFMNSLPVNTESPHSYNRVGLRRLILDLIAENETTVRFDQKKDDNGNWFFTSHLQRRISENVEWIRDNLDVWEVIELPPTVSMNNMEDDDQILYTRHFKFERKPNQ